MEAGEALQRASAMLTKEMADLRRFIGAQIRRERVRKGWSQQDLGEQIGVSFQQVQKYERGANNISAHVLFAIAALFNKPVAAFFPPGNGEAIDLSVETAMATRLGVRLAGAFAGLPSEKAREAAVVLVEALLQATGGS